MNKWNPFRFHNCICISISDACGHIILWFIIKFVLQWIWLPNKFDVYISNRIWIYIYIYRFSCRMIRICILYGIQSQSTFVIVSSSIKQPSIWHMFYGSVFTGSTFKCPSEGYQPDPQNCTKFYRCVKEESETLKAYEFECGPGTVFSTSTDNCVGPSDSGRPECASVTANEVDSSANEVDSGGKIIFICNK